MENCISKKEVIKYYKEEANCTQKDATFAINLLIKLVAEQLKDGNAVRLDGIGTFEVRERKRYQGFNPQNGERIEVGESSFLHFSATPSLVRSLNTWRYWPEEESAAATH